MTDQITTNELLELNEQRAREIVSMGQETAVWALLELSALARKQQAEGASNSIDPSTPSSQIPPYKKPNGSKKKRKKPGRPKGHEGARRADPTKIDREEEHTLCHCPHCNTKVRPLKTKRTRIIEDIVQTTAEAVLHIIYGYICPNCKKRVEPKVTDAPPKSRMGYRAIAITAYFHYSLGLTLSRIRDVLNSLFQMTITDGGLIHQWKNMAKTLSPWYDQIHNDAVASAVLHADETGWRVNGETHWLWGFFSKDSAYYLIHPTRSGDVPLEVLKDVFDGILITDFYSAYDRLDVARQTCLAHLFRELKKVSEQEGKYGIWNMYAQTLKRLLRDAIRLSRKRSELDADVYQRRRDRIHKRLNDLVDTWTCDPNVSRIDKRLKKFSDTLFTFLDVPDLPFDNNHAEREIRPAVIARKNSFHNMSERGARTQSVLMSIYRTLKLRGHDPIQTIIDALKTHTATGKLPPLPEPKPPG